MPIYPFSARGVDTNTHAPRSSWPHGRILCRTHEYLANIPVHAFLHHRRVTYAAAIAEAESSGSKYEIKT